MLLHSARVTSEGIFCRGRGGDVRRVECMLGFISKNREVAIGGKAQSCAGTEGVKFEDFWLSRKTGLFCRKMPFLVHSDELIYALSCP